MLKPVATRLLRMVFVLWVVSIATFLLVDLLPGDPVRVVLGPEATDTQVAYVRNQLGLDQPLVHRYFDWIGGVLTFDFGKTLVPPVQSVSSIMAGALPITLQLALMAIVMGLAGGVALGTIAASNPNGRLDRMITSGSFALVSLPTFVLALLLIRLLVFNIDAFRASVLALGVVITAGVFLSTLWAKRFTKFRNWRWLLGWMVPAFIGLLLWATVQPFPREGWIRLSDDPRQNLVHAFLPALTLALSLIPLYAQLLRADLTQTMRMNFITVARAKGMPKSHLMLREALRPSLFSLVTVAGITFGNLVGGSVIVESIFGLPGLGRTLVTSIQSKDFAVVQIGVLIAAALFLALNTLIDIGYMFLDPRLRRARH